MKRFLVCAVLAVLAMAHSTATAQDWRRQQSGGYQGGGFYVNPGHTQPGGQCLDPTSTNDQFQPLGQVSQNPPQGPPSWPQQQPWPQQQWPQYPQSNTTFYPPQPLPMTPSWPQQGGQRRFLGVWGANAQGGGAYITGVQPNAAAFRVGIEPGDIIYSVDGIPVNSFQELSNAIRLSDGFVDLRIRDRNTGNIVQRNVDVTQ